MLVEFAVGLLIVASIAYGFWKSWTTGELAMMRSTFQSVSELQEDVFGGETRTLQCAMGEKEHAFEIKTLGDALNVFMYDNGSGILYLQSSKEHGVRIEFTLKSEQGDDFMTFRTIKGEEMLEERTVNLDKEGPSGTIQYLKTTFGDLRANSGTWWNNEESTQ